MLPNTVYLDIQSQQIQPQPQPQHLTLRYKLYLKFTADAWLAVDFNSAF